MASDSRRLLGFAFTNADFLMEIDRDGIILFAAGAAGGFTDRTELIGTKARDLFDGKDAMRFSVEANLLAPGGRKTLTLAIPGKDEARVSLFRLPDNADCVSCTLAPVKARAGFPAAATDAKTGLATRESFLDAANAKAGDNDALTLLNVPALNKICAELGPEKADALMAAIGAAIAASGAKAVGRISETSFGAVSDAGKGPQSQIPGVRAAMAKRGLAATDIQETQVSLKAPALRSEQRFLALRYVVEFFTSGKRGKHPGNDLGQAFEAMMDETQTRVRTLTDTVAAGDFALAYQPIKDLKTGELSHFEALARFGKRGETGETIQFVEKLGIADAFDLAVAVKVIGALETDKSHAAHVAFNLSGHTIESPTSFGMLAGLLARQRKLAPRLLIEVTETAAIADLAAAAKAIDALRAMGYRVGLDDFGAGAATLNYLHAFNVDFVKFDGALVKKLGASARDDTLLAAMLRLCDELGFTTIAECLENEADIAKARSAGFRHGQGYALGAPGPIPPGAGMKKAAVKRRGVTESWE